MIVICLVWRLRHPKCLYSRVGIDMLQTEPRVQAITEDFAELGVKATRLNESIRTKKTFSLALLTRGWSLANRNVMFKALPV